MHIGSDSITCTLEHPFFVKNVWVAAKDLRAGDPLFAYSGAKLRIDSLHQFKTDTATAVYNLEVAGNNDFYVSASKVLVHNKAASGKAIMQAVKLAKKLNLKEINNYLLKDGETGIIDIAKHFNNKPGKLDKWILEYENGIGHGCTFFKLKLENKKGYWSLTPEGKILRWKP